VLSWMREVDIELQVLSFFMDTSFRETIIPLTFLSENCLPD
jgi:hypothetical protein